MSMEKKTITINPDLFQLNGGGKTKKSTQNKKTENQIKMKPTHTPLSNAKNNTLKRKILKVIRAKQQDEYKRLFSKPKTHELEEKTNDTEISNTVEDKFNKDFDKSLQYLSVLEKKVDNENLQKPANNMNHTFRNYPQYPPQYPPQYSPQSLQIHNELPTEFILPLPTDNSQPLTASYMRVKPEPYNIPVHPGYGCLKGGSMPTYRTIKNKQVYQIESPTSSTTENTDILLEKENTIPVIPQLLLQSDQKQALMKAELRHHRTQDTSSQYNKIKNMKRRKIYKRTYHVGKSKTAPKIGCLISNKTIRQKIQQTAYDLKHTNMKDVRKFLLKRGFIKIGTTAPNDVLRKMYESVAMVCGEVQNHNPDNLLFNFMNDNDNNDKEN